MSRHEVGLKAAQEAEKALVDLLSRQFPAGPDGTDRKAAMAIFLSASEGWEEAMESLGGAFAREARRPARLTPGKEG